MFVIGKLIGRLEQYAQPELDIPTLHKDIPSAPLTLSNLDTLLSKFPRESANHHIQQSKSTQ